METYDMYTYVKTCVYMRMHMYENVSMATCIFYMDSLTHVYKDSKRCSHKNNLYPNVYRYAHLYPKGNTNMQTYVYVDENLKVLPC